jgi:hypothetical protein
VDPATGALSNRTDYILSGLAMPVASPTDVVITGTLK